MQTTFNVTSHYAILERKYLCELTTPFDHNLLAELTITKRCAQYLTLSIRTVYVKLANFHSSNSQI
jgi:hypothetical protein